MQPHCINLFRDTTIHNCPPKDLDDSTPFNISLEVLSPKFYLRRMTLPMNSIAYKGDSPNILASQVSSNLCMKIAMMWKLITQEYNDT